MQSKSKYDGTIHVVPEDTASIEDLCRPLSAHVLPRSALLSSNGSALEPGRVMARVKRREGLGAGRTDAAEGDFK